MKILNFKDFIKKIKLKEDTMNESQLQRVYNYPIHPDIRKCIPIKVLFNKSYNFDSFGDQADKISLNQLPKPIAFHKCKIQDINSKLCGTYCLYFFYLIERLNYYDTFFKLVFE